MEKRFVSCAASETFYFVAPDLSSQIGPKKTILILPILSFRSWLGGGGGGGGYQFAVHFDRKEK